MDLEMPVMGGLEAVSHIRESERKLGISSSSPSSSLPSSPSLSLLSSPKSSPSSPSTHSRRIPIVVLSGNARQKYANEAESESVDDFIVKPYQKKDLLDLAQKLSLEPT
eukprot:TRINITY_DN8051_c2_g2_i2.p1 TRINITY_DN8051_c2_g2~~TRINITY_DN8051_c2_g2_i2.p1  ORF type:complete len:109 (+),score=26.79 TRINITY_DN8051_c2_g2_i2:159-485(+)